MEIDYQYMVKEFIKFQKIDEFFHSDVYEKYKEELSSLFNKPIIYEPAKAKPRIDSFIRIAQWNIEQGIHLDKIISILNTHPILKFADILFLNELDLGMLRSGNRNVPMEICNAINANCVYGVDYLEMTKGIGEQLNIPGENTSSLHGNAIFTRYPFSNVEIKRLSRCENNFESDEKRLGGRIGVLCDIKIGITNLLAATTHLDVVNTPNCRAKQLSSLLEHIENRINKYDYCKKPVIIGGDLNTHTFSRDTFFRTMKNFIRIMYTREDKFEKQLLNPIVKEPLLKKFLQYGYQLSELNDNKPSAWSTVSGLKDINYLPLFIRKWTNKRYGKNGLILELRLDWFAAKDLNVLKKNVTIDKKSGAVSTSPLTISGIKFSGSRITDHDPIVIDVNFP